ncbi:MAG: hypothetical protein HXS46_06450 [Theionarchaea archaeon]|nr:hypothetical protein [Theionarchaea archaeon]
MYVMEFDLYDYMEEEKEKTFIFEWYWSTEKPKSHTAVVFLPTDAELLEVAYAIPRKVEETDRVAVYYEGESTPSQSFRFQLTFSSTGKGYVKLAERYKETGQYDLAISYYQKAKSFYNRFTLYRKDKSAILKELQDNIFAIQEIQADTMFQGAMNTFQHKNYEEARAQFEQTQTLYRILKNGEREAACQEMIAECERMEQLKKEADNLFELGRSQYEAEQYEKAKESFVQAKEKYEEQEDTDKVAECDQWIVTCDEAEVGTGLCILGILVILLWKKYS